jgi:hypothetical protein
MEEKRIRITYYIMIISIAVLCAAGIAVFGTKPKAKENLFYKRTSLLEEEGFKLVSGDEYYECRSYNTCYLKDSSLVILEKDENDFKYVAYYGDSYTSKNDILILSYLTDTDNLKKTDISLSYLLNNNSKKIRLTYKNYSMSIEKDNVNKYSDEYFAYYKEKIVYTVTYDNDDDSEVFPDSYEIDYISGENDSSIINESLNIIISNEDNELNEYKDYVSYKMNELKDNNEIDISLESKDLKYSFSYNTSYVNKEFMRFECYARENKTKLYGDNDVISVKYDVSYFNDNLDKIVDSDINYLKNKFNLDSIDKDKIINHINEFKGKEYYDKESILDMDNYMILPSTSYDNRYLLTYIFKK